ncbi:hypothetical protein F5Y17DRAFT_70130 [Xylariaceae sp. FL0594]|nr:hypothetical protein F5Y17DRAFT_70130 [Xylariaceae sp. FL0594]
MVDPIVKAAPGHRVKPDRPCYRQKHSAVAEVGYIGRHTWDVPLAVPVLKLPHQTRVINSLSQPITGLVKISILMFYLRVFGVQRVTKVMTICGIIFVAILYGAFTITFAILDPTLHRPSVVKLSETQAAISVATDLFLLVLPISSVVRLQMSRSRKLAIVAIFSSGIAALVLSILTLYWRSSLSKAVLTDSTWLAATIFTVSLVEIDIGILCACLPLFGPLANRVNETMKDWTNYIRVKGSRLRLYGSRSGQGRQNHHSGAPPQRDEGEESSQKHAVYIELDERKPKSARPAKKHWFDRSIAGVSTMGTDTALNDDRVPLWLS